VALQMDGFVDLLSRLVIAAGIDRTHIYHRDSLELPGYMFLLEESARSTSPLGVNERSC
jgi:hypothetical protein